MRRFLGFLCFAILFQLAFAADPEPGYLANPGFENEAIKSVFFFTGNWRNGYTEGMAGVPSVQYGDAAYFWMCTHFGGINEGYVKVPNYVVSATNVYGLTR